MEKFLSCRNLAILIFLIILIFIVGALNPSYKERVYKHKINGLQFGYIDRTRSQLFVAVKHIDTVSLNLLVNSMHCLQEEEDKKGHPNISTIEIYDRFLYLDQVTPKNLYTIVRFKHFKPVNVNRRKIIIEYVKLKKTIEVDYDRSGIECNFE